MSIFEKSLQNVKIDTTQVHENMQVTPLFLEIPGNKDYLILDEAIKEKVARIMEVSEAGNVPELKFVNSSTTSILLLDGEELIGAKQNRIVNLTILVGPERTITIPVSCVEAGRWQHNSREFETSERTLYSNVRASKAQDVSDSMKHSGSRESDQGDLWGHINAKMNKMQSHSETSAMSQIFDDNKHSLDDYVSAFSFQQNQCGAIFSIDGIIKGLEIFDNENTYQMLMNKLLRSYALDALETLEKFKEEKANPKMTSQAEAQLFLDSLSDAPIEEFPGTDQGTDIRFDSEDLSGGGLVHQDKLIHLCVFPTDIKQAQTYN